MHAHNNGTCNTCTRIQGLPPQSVSPSDFASGALTGNNSISGKLRHFEQVAYRLGRSSLLGELSKRWATHRSERLMQNHVGQRTGHAARFLGPTRSQARQTIALPANISFTLDSFILCAFARNHCREDPAEIRQAPRVPCSKIDRIGGFVHNVSKPVLSLVPRGKPFGPKAQQLAQRRAQEHRPQATLVSRFFSSGPTGQEFALLNSIEIDQKYRGK